MTTSREESRTTETEDTPDVDEPADETPLVNARSVHDDRTVFTEDGNSDGWISTDLTVTPTR